MIQDLCFEIIQKCLNNCKFCSSFSCTSSPNVIEYELFEKVLKFLVDNGGVKEISISGGEPFLHKDLLKMVALCKSHNIKTCVYTSGIVENSLENWKADINNLNEAEKKQLKRALESKAACIKRDILFELKEIGLDKIVFDVQAIDIDVYDNIMGTKNYETYLANSMIYAKSAGLFTEVHYIPMKSNANQIEDILDVCYIVEVDKLSILKFVPQGRGRENKDELMLSKAELEDFTRKLHELDKKYQRIYNYKKKVDIRLGIPMMKENKHLCTAGYNKLSIRYDGMVLPCVAFKEMDTDIIKSVFEKNGIPFKLFSIKDDLNKLSIKDGNSKIPICKQVYDAIENRNMLYKEI